MADQERARTEAPKAGEGKKKYVVAGGGVALQKGRPIQPGSVVALTDAEARRFDKLGRLRPFFEDQKADPVVQADAERAPARRQAGTVATDNTPRRAKAASTASTDSEKQ